MASKRKRFADSRRVAGFSQEQLAEHLGVERSTVARWEAGETTPQPWLRPKLAEALSVSPAELHELLTDVDDEHPALDMQREQEEAPGRRLAPFGEKPPEDRRVLIVGRGRHVLIADK